MHPKMNDACLKMIFYWIRHNLTYIGNRRNYSDYAGLMPESSLAALLSSNESASTIKCITKQTRTGTNYRKESEGVERPFCRCVVSVQALIIRLAADSPGRWGNTCTLRKPNRALARGHRGRIIPDHIETQVAACRSIHLTGYWGWIKVLQEEAAPFHLQGWSRVVSVCHLVSNKANPWMQALFVRDAENTNIQIYS